MLKIDIITLFPEMFQGPFQHSIIKSAQAKGLVEINLHNLRNYAIDEHGTVDDKPYGGGLGMILRVEPVFQAIAKIKDPNLKNKIILLTPQGKTFKQKQAQGLVKFQQLIFICGHYEGVDERIRQHFVDEEISLGDFILTGGEIPTMAVIDSIVRLIPGVLDKEAHLKDSFSLTLEKGDKTMPLLEYPQYTRPENFQGHRVPQILLSGDHASIEKWRQEKALKKTQERRPDLLTND